MSKHPDTLLRDLGFMLLTWLLILGAWLWNAFERGDALLREIVRKL